MKVRMLLLAALLASLSATLLPGCAAGGGVPAKAPTITINTIPTGADISVNGNYVGVAPVEIPMPASRIDKGAYYAIEHRLDQPLQIEAQLKGYESKFIAFGIYHAEVQKLVQPVFSASAVAKTAAGYYTFAPTVTIKLAEK